MNIAPLMAEGFLVIAHTLTALLAVGLGAIQFIMPKGTTSHRMIGYSWVSLMAVVALSSFGIFSFRILGPFSPIHLLSALTLFFLVYSIYHIRRGNVEHHKQSMMGMYFGGLLIAGALTLIPGRTLHQVVFGS